MMECQRGHSCTAGQSRVVTLQATTVQPPVSTQLSQSNHPKKSSVMNTPKMMESIHTSVKHDTGALLRKTERGSMTISNAMKAGGDSQSEVHIGDPDLLKSFPVATQISYLDKVAVVQAPKLEAQEITISAHDQLSARIAAVQAKAETDKTGTNIQTEIPKAKLGEKADLKQGLQCIPLIPTAAPSKQTTSMLEIEPGTVNLPQTDGSTGSVQTRPPSETVKVTSKIIVIPIKVSGPHFCRAKGTSVGVFGKRTAANDNDIKPESAEAEVTSLVPKSDQSSSLSVVFNSKQNKITVSDHTKSGTVISPVSSPGSDGNIENKTATTNYKVESVNNEKVANDFHETKKIKVAPTLHYLNKLADQEALFNTAESKKSISLTDYGVALGSSDTEELLNPEETDVFLSPTKTETEINYTDQVFHGVESVDCGKIPDLLLSANDPAVYPSRNDSEKCPTETNRSQSSKGKEAKEESCLNQAKAHIKLVEKCFLSTKEESQSLSFSSQPVFPGKHRNRRVTISVQGRESLCFGSFKDNKVRSSSIDGTEFRALGGYSILEDKGEQLDFDTLHWKNLKDTIPSRDSYRNTDIKDVKSQGGRYDSENQKEISLPILGGSVIRVSGNMPAINTDVTKDLAANCNDTIANSSGTVISNAEPTGVQERFRRGRGEWIIYGDSVSSFLDSTSSLSSKWTKEELTSLPASSPKDIVRISTRRSGLSLLKEGQSQQILSVATKPVTIVQSETGRRGESEEWKHSVDNCFSLLSTKYKESSATEMLHATSQPGTQRFGRRGSREWESMVTHLATSPPQIRRYGNRGRGEWVVGGSSDCLLNTESKECPPITTSLATSPPRTGRFGINENGEGRLYGGHTGHMSSLSGRNSLATAERRESPSVARQHATSPQVIPGAGRFGSEGSGKWQVYGQSNERLGGVRGPANISESVQETRTISLSSSFTHRFSSAGSGGRLSSGSVVRRSRSVGSTGRLSSSGGAGKLSSSPRSYRRSTGKCCDERKPIYSSGSGCRSSVGSAGPSNGTRMTSIKTTPSTSGRISSSSQWLSSNNRTEISSTGNSLSMHDRRTRQATGGFSSSSAPGRTNSTNGCDRPIRSTGSGTSGNKERISVCKMAALSISAAGREKSQERRKSAQQSHQQHAAGGNRLLCIVSNTNNNNAIM